MPLLKKRKKNSKPNTQVYMPYKKTPLKVERRKRKKFSFLKSNSSKKNYRRKKNNISYYFFYIIIALVLLALLYISTLFVINMRQGTVDNSPEEYVVGLDKIPVFSDPSTKRKADFIFANTLEEASVANFISSGNSAYRVPIGSTLEDVYEFYENILPSKGWGLVLTVDIGSEEMKQGQYWIKGDKGLRIYSKFNDIWYEMITSNQAISGLRERVEKEIERELLLANQELQDLLPDFPWSLKVPKEYIISYKAAEFEDMRSVEFRRLGTNETITVTPVGYISSKPLDNLLREYIEIVNDTENGISWNITNTILIYTEYGRALKGSISSINGTHDIAVIPNSYDKIAYVVDSSLPDNPFFDYVITALTPQGLEKD
jgi:hypothetical protein